jgi:hypothetical protein
MKINVFEERIICSNPNSINNYFAWPSVARLRDGRLAMVASGFRWRHVCPFGKVIICFSEDEGKSWSAPAVIIDTALDDRDAGVLQLPNGDILVTTFNDTLESFYEEYGDDIHPYIKGYVDTAMARAGHDEFKGSVIAISKDNGKSFKKLFNLPITTPHGPCLLQDGTILYVGMKYYRKNLPAGEMIIDCYKVDPEGSYEYLSSIEDPSKEIFGEKVLACEPHTIQLKNGTIISHIRVHNYERKLFTLFQAESYDGGKTWTKPHQILEDRGGAPAHIIEHSSGMLISAYGCRKEPTLGVKLMFSRDGGKTWDTDHVLYHNEYSDDLGYPCTVELQD